MRQLAVGLNTGTRLGPYEIATQIGKGGMGEVYRALDTNLGRHVAIKILPETFADDSERLARFEREAKTLASLNHANIAQIYGFERAGTVRALVMELVEGETLADRLARDGAPVFDAAIKIAVQVAAALDAAHEKEIVHRDLKPANIGLTTSGTVKLLDFGLAKVANAPAPSSHEVTTQFESMTQVGVVIGTLPYMSPEQLQGKPVDQRTDIWAFGAILFELFTGRRLFRGESSADIVAAVMTQPIDLTAVPAQVRALLARCLERDPARRLRHIGDIALQLESESMPAAPPLRRRPIGGWFWPAAVIAGMLAALAAGWMMRPPASAPTAITRLEVVEPEGVSFTDRFTVSPDGQRIAFMARVGEGQQLWVRSLESFDARALVAEPIDGSMPIWSPDLTSIAYWHRGTLYRIDMTGASPQSIAKAPQPGSGFWTRDDRIVFATRAEGLLQVSVRTGEVAPLTALTPGELLHRTPSPLPDGSHFIYARLTDPDRGNIHVGAFDTAPDAQDSAPLLVNATAAAFVSAPNRRDGYLVFFRGGRLLAQRFDPSRRTLAGDPILLAEHVAARQVVALGGGSFQHAAFSMSGNGVLAYRSELKAADQLTVFDRKGSIVDRIGETALHGQIDLSPDESRLAVVRRDGEQADVYIYELSGARRQTRFTFTPTSNATPVWSPDGRRIAFSGVREAGRLDLFVKGALTDGGAEELLYRAAEAPGVRPTDWSSDGRYVLLWSTIGSEKPRNDVMVVSVADRQVRTLIRDAGFASFSPDGRWVAYWTNRSGQGEIYVRPFDPSGAVSDPPEWTVSSRARSIRPIWRGDEIFYRSREQHIMSVRVKGVSGARPTFSAGVPEPLFPLPNPIQPWAVSRDRQRFIVPMPATPAQAAAYKIVMNWGER